MNNSTKHWMPRLNVTSNEGKMRFERVPVERFTTIENVCSCGYSRAVRRRGGTYGCLRCGRDRKAA